MTQTTTRQQNVLDGLTKTSATRLAAQIENYWHARGFAPAVWIEKVDLPNGTVARGEIWVVRSDLVDGRPRKVGA